MTSRNWVHLFLTTLAVGAVTTAVVGFIVRWSEFQHLLSDFNILEFLSILVWLMGVGLIFSILSQMGFFAYLTVHRFGLGIFKSLWNPVQVLLIAFVLFDLVYLRFATFAENGESIMSYLGLAVIVLVAGLIVAFMKVKQTNKEAFIPALFFMIVVTVVEWVPVLRVNEHSWLYLMLFPLLVCNAYQLLVLHKLNQKSLQERKVLEEKAKSNVKPNKKAQKKPSNA
ncbi:MULTISPECIES: KinB-signaling pathway activation protein [Mesobacillus]|uniref:KinB-signaling pathway activation protein n=1 Tax=Mesobacillus selenatarsenatis TaxID=388741 RepID=A0A846TZF8_9BACI|nr:MULTISPECIES: KinB-signaling pathway activation protein [Mesobacillus]NKE07761.1 KinB-signaling pathway activation protein [Mesobacillus selenatarsenatis]